MSTGRGIWAVLVGVGYTSGEDAWPGSKHDVQRVNNFLLRKGTHPAQIKRLEDQEATHDAITRLINTHLLNNASIQRDDPILIYFSGHGTSVTAPETWPVEGPDRRMEAFVTYNSQLPEGDPSREDVLPDRTINALLKRLHSRHGNNITVILDCCYSGHMNRDGHSLPEELRYRPRNINASWLKISPDTDADIWGGIEDVIDDTDDRPRQRGARILREYDSHVLLAACDRTETAEGNPRGGLFTAALIAALDEGDNITYNQLQQRIKWNYQSFWKAACDQLDHFLKKNPEQAKPFHGPRYPSIQSPQCVGPRSQRNRLLWKAVGDTTQSFSVEMAKTTPAGTKQCKIHAGGNIGVQPGTVFEIITATREGHEARTYAATASTAEAAWCFCDLPDDADFEPDNVKAVIVSKPINPVKYYIDNTEVGLQVADECVLHLRGIFEMHSQERDPAAVLEQSKDSADVILQVDYEGVLVHRQDPLFLRLQIVPPRVAFADVIRVFPEVFRSIARFHTYLNLENPASQLTKQVDLKLHMLMPADAQIGWLEAEPLRQVGKEIIFINDEATFQSPEEGLDHALVLTNTSDKDLFPYVFWFDTATYSITLMYSTQNDDEAPLRKLGAPPIPEADKPQPPEDGDAEDDPQMVQREEDLPPVPGVLQIGGSRECGSPIVLYAPASMPRDVGFVKVFLADHPVDLSSLEQDAILGVDEDDRPNFLNCRSAPENPNDSSIRKCSSIMKAVTVIPEQAT